MEWVVKQKSCCTKNTIILVFLFFLCSDAFSNILIPYYRNGLWGLCDSNKRIIVEPVYNGVEWIDGNLYKVYTLIDSKIDTNKIQKVGLVNAKGKMIIPDTFNNISLLSNKYSQKTIIEAYYDSLHICYFTINGKYLLTSSISINENYQDVNLLEPFIIFSERHGYYKYGYFHIPTGKFVKKELRYLESIPFIKGAVIMTLMNLKKVQIDSNNNQVKNPYYKDVIHHGNNVYSAIVDNKRIWLNEKGKRMANKDFWWIDKFEGKYAIVRKGEKLGVVDSKFKLIIPYKYYAIKIISNNRFFVRDRGKWGMLNSKNQKKIELKYDYIEETEIYLGGKNNNLILGSNPIQGNDGYYRNVEDLFMSNGLHISHGENGEVSMRNIYMEELGMRDVNYGIGIVVQYWPCYKNDSCILIDKDLKPKSKRYKSLKLINANLYRFEENGKFGVMRLDGSILLPAIYHHIPGMQGKDILVCKNYLIGVKRDFYLPNDSIFSDTTFTCIFNKNFPYYGYTVVKIDSSKIAQPFTYKTCCDATNDGLVLKSKKGENIRVPINMFRIVPEELNQYRFIDSNYLKISCGIDDNISYLIDTPLYKKGYFDFNIIETKLWGLIDTNNQVVLPIEQEGIAIDIIDNWHLNSDESIKIYHQNITTIKHNNKIGFFKADGNYLIKPEYDDIRLIEGEAFVSSTFHDGVAIVAKNGQFGMIDTNNNIIIPFKYRYLVHTYDAPYELNGDTGNGMELIKLNVNEMLFKSSYHQWGKKLYYLYDKNIEGSPRKLLGLIDEQGKEYFDR
jgi:hypothetical protein